MLVRGFAIDVGSIVAGRYRVEGLLGRGGFGAVFSAFDQRLGRDVALKLLFSGLVTTEGVARFKREAEIAQRLTGPHVARLYDFGSTEDGTPFIALEKIPGTSLAELVRGPLGVARSVRIVRQALGALEEAHAIGIVHRDIKPANLMVSSFTGAADFVKVLDFGIASAVVPSKLTRQGQGSMGTPGYMAPEQILGKPADARSDLFSLGVVLLEAVTGARLFPDDNPLKIASFHASAEPVAIPGALARTPLGPILARALEKDPTRRFQFAAEMARALEALPPMAEPVLAPAAEPVLAPVVPPPPARRSPAWVPVLGVLGALIVVGGLSVVVMRAVSSPASTSPPKEDDEGTPKKRRATSEPPAPSKTEAEFMKTFSVRGKSVASLIAGIEAAGYRRQSQHFDPDYFKLTVARLDVEFTDPSGRVATLECFQQGVSTSTGPIPEDRAVAMEGRTYATLSIVDASGVARPSDSRTVLGSVVPLREL